jgi:rRNA-processing protein FCF1
MKSDSYIIDTNLLVLLLIGLDNPRTIKSHDRTSKYNLEDFEMVKAIFYNALKVYITPHILSEISNLTDKQWNNYDLFNIFKALAKAQIEIYTPKETLLDFQFLPQIGITDTSLYFAAKETHSIVLTDDEKCAPYLESSGCEVLRFSTL